jgi:hypothetical protein
MPGFADLVSATWLVVAEDFARVDFMDTNIVVALIGAAGVVTAAVIPIIFARRRDHSPPSNGQAPSTASVGVSLNLGDILARLEQYRQRATFGAVAGLLHREPLTLFDGYPRSPRTSWVVSKSTGKPTGQDGSALHPDLFKNPHVISYSAELESWLATHPYSWAS